MVEEMKELAAELVALEAETDTVLDEPEQKTPTGLAFAVNAKRFRDAMTLLGKVTPRHGPQSMLGHVLLEGKEGGKVWATVTDLKNRLMIELDGANVIAPGSLLVPLKALSQAVGKGKGYIELKTTEEGVRVTGEHTATIPAGDLDKFPAAFPAGKSSGFHTSEDFSHFQNRLESVAFAMDNTEATAWWSVANIQIAFDRENDRGGGSGLAATDTRRLAVSGDFATFTAKPKGEEQTRRSALINPTAVKVLLAAKIQIGKLTLQVVLNDVEKTTENDDGKVRTVRTEREPVLIFHANGFHLVAKVPEGRFPLFVEIWPKAVPYSRPTFRASELKSAIDAACGSGRKDDENVRLEMAFAESGVTLERYHEGGLFRAVVPVTGWRGDAVEISVNPYYLRDYLDCVHKSETVEIDIHAKDKPVVMRGSGTASQYLVMPLTG